MTRRVFIWARESNGDRWPQDVANPPPFRDDKDAEVISPSRSDHQRFAQAKLFYSDGSLFLLFKGMKTSYGELRPERFDNTRLLVPNLFDKKLRDGIVLIGGDGGSIADFLPCASGTSDQNRGWMSALDRRGWTLLEQRAIDSTRHLLRVTIVTDGVTTGDTKVADVWLNPLVIIFRGENPIPALGSGEPHKIPIERAIHDAQNERHALVAEMPIDVQRRVIGWQVIWGSRKDSALSALFNREPANDEHGFSAPFVDLALLDSFGGTFLAGRVAASGCLSWDWIPPDDQRRHRLDEAQVMEYLLKVLGFESAPKPPDPSSRFDWGVETRDATLREIRVPIEESTDAAKRLKYLTRAAKELPSGGLVLARILERFTETAGRMSLEDAEEIFHPLLYHSMIEKGLLIADEQTLLRTIQMQFFMPRSNVFVPFEAIERDEVDATKCSGTRDFSMWFDPFRSPQDPFKLLRQVVGLSDGAGVADQAPIRSQWYDIFWRHVAIGHNKHAFRLVDETSRFVLDRSALDEGRLA